MVQLVGGIKSSRVAQSDGEDWMTTTEKVNQTWFRGREKGAHLQRTERNKFGGELSCKNSSSIGKSTSMPRLYYIAFDCKF